MKKLLALVLMAIMALTLLAGCGNPVYDDLENYLNVEMAEVNAYYTQITAEVGTWETAADDAALEASINNVLLPLVNSSLEKLKDVNPATDEVKALKEAYVKVMDAYKKGFETLAEGCRTQDEATINAGSESLNQGLTYLEEYTAALEALAAKVGAQIEY